MRMDKAEAFGAVERLAALEEIRQLKHRYFTATDGKDWATLRGVYTDDATFSTGTPTAGGPALDGIDAFIRFLSSPERAKRQTKHHGHNDLITLTSPTEAEGSWDYEAVTWQIGADGKLEDQPVPHTWGKYNDHYRKTPAGWRIAHMSATTLHKA
jgi:ketosteroid isomerase-like protein